MADELADDLRKLAALLAQASETVARIADKLTPKPPEPPPAPPAPAEPDWNLLADTAITLLDNDPHRAWKPDELAWAVATRAHVDVDTPKLLAKLRERRAIREVEGGAVRSAAMMPVAPTVIETSTDPITALGEEIDRMRPYLQDLSVRERTAQVCAWAGQARKLQDGPVPAEQAAEMRAVFGRLTRITQEMPCDWVDALRREWVTDWDAYVAYYRNQPLTHEQDQALHRQFLRGLFTQGRRVSEHDAHSLLVDAMEVLPGDDPDLRRAIDLFGDPYSHEHVATSRRPKERGPAPEPEKAPDDVLAVTRGRKALIAGGQGTREEHRRAIVRSLELADLEWVTSERSQASVFTQLAERIRPGRYDLVIFLASYSSHKSNAFVRACKDAAIPFVYITRGYSVSSIIHAIQEQVVHRREVAVD